MRTFTLTLAALAALVIAIPAATSTPAAAEKIVVTKHKNHERFIPRAFHREHREKTVVIRGRERGDHDRY